jgi:tripartite-type tricarboxylate transporter receptor subunit TctC
VRIVVPYPPGGGTDVVARAIGQKLAEAWKQNVVIDNRGGGGGNIGTEFVARAAPDGYTLLMAISTFTVNPSIFKQLPWDPVRDFAPVSKVGSSAYILVVHPSLPARSVSELIALARAKPDALSFGSSGIGAPLHLAGELFKTRANIKMVHVPYKGAGPAVIDLLGGQFQVYFGSTVTMLPFIRNGRLRALATTSARRLPVAPEIPTMAEAGVPDCEVDGWYGMLGPAGTPPDRIRKLSDQLAAILRMPDIREGFAKGGQEALGTTPEEFGRFIVAEVAKWSKVVKAAGITGD